MNITIELEPDVEKWIATKVQSGGFTSASEFVNAQLSREYLEEAIGEAMLEPAEPLTATDWAEERRRLDKAIFPAT